MDMSGVKANSKPRLPCVVSPLINDVGDMCAEFLHACPFCHTRQNEDSLAAGE